MTILRVLLMSLLLTLTTAITAQFNKLFTSDNGLPNSLVNDITQDTDGMLWIATENGLSCFNGSRFINYRSEKSDKHSLANNFIRKVRAGDDGQILLGTVDGVQIYNKYTNSFSEVVSSEAIGVSTSNVNDIYRLHDGSYLVAGYDAYTIVIDEDGVVQVKKNAMTGKVTNIYKVTEGVTGDLWCVRGGKGVCRAMGNNLTHIKDKTGGEYNFYSICTGNDGCIYAGHTESGLYIFNPQTNHFSLLPGTESLRTIRDIVPLPKSDILCVAMDGSGVRYYDTKLRQFVTSGLFSDPFVDVSSQKAHALFVDNEGNIWMALYQSGVYFAAANTAGFGYFGPRSPQYNIIGDRCVTSIMQSHDGTVWVSTDNGGLYGIDTDGKALRHFVSDNSKEGLPTTLLGLFQDSHHRTWFGSFQRGAGIVDLGTGRCDYVPLEGVSGNTGSIYEYIEDKRGTVWAATMGHGIARYDEDSRSLRIFNGTDDVQWSDCLFYDEINDILYAGTYDGVVWFSATASPDAFKDNKKAAHTKVCGGNVVYSISRISNTQLAFCTTSGLIVYDTAKKAVAYTLGQEQGLSDNNVLAADMGNDGRLWISSSNGIVRYDLKTKTVEAYSVLDGLQGNEFYKNASLVSRDGRLWFGGINGITVFSPQDIGMLKPQQCRIRIASLHTNETFIPRNKEGVYVLPGGSNSVTIELSTRPLHMSRRVIYQYKLDGGEWATLPVGQTRITFSELSYGSHTLYMKTTIGGVETEVFEEEIYVPYPWYLSWWAWILWIGIVVGLTLYIYNSLRRRHLLNQELKKHQEEEAISEAKLSFFMNVVHDLRTPLSLVFSPLQKLKRMDNDESHTRLYGIMQKSVDRLIRLSNEIMDVRKLSMGKMQLYCKEVNVSDYLRGIIDSVGDLADANHQELIAEDHTDGSQVIWMDPVAVEKVMLNLLGNAIKYTPNGGMVTAEWEVCGDSLHVMVTDTGIGIPDSDKDKVFTSFFRREVASRYYNGTGLGLSLVKSLIELHHGEIHVEDNPKGQGTRMHFLLPVTKEAYTEEELKPWEEEAPVVEAVVEEVELDEPLDEEMATSSERVPKTTLRKRNILIVDDDKDILDYLCDELSGTYNIIPCCDGKEAYDMLLRIHNEKSEKRQIDVIVSDVMMPEVDGLELCHLVRRNVNLNHIPVVLLTAKSSESDQLQGLQASADAYVTKPFSMDILLAVIDNLLIRQNIMRNKYKGATLPVDNIETPELKTADDVFLEKIQKVINDHIGNPDITSDFVAEKMGMSRVHMYRKLKELTNQSCSNYIRNIRLAKAAEILCQGNVPVTDVAATVGFKTMSYFSTSFRALYGVSPSEYKRE